jgi:dTDP-4-dehydrorhamnose 3,5-epimerase-like enzyme
MEFEINPLDPVLAVPWPLSGEPILSAKDAGAPTLEERRVAQQLPLFH